MNTGYDAGFMQGDTWRVFRIMAEFIEGFEEMAQFGPCVPVFGSARSTEDNPNYKLAVELGRRLADEGFVVVTGAGPGIMEAANRGAKEGRAASVGINIDLPFEQAANEYLDKLINMRYFFVRKVLFLKYAVAAVLLPGGYGTMDEFFEFATLIQTKKVFPIPVYLMGEEGYWKGLLSWMRKELLERDRISPGDLEIFKVTNEIEEVVRGVKVAAERRGDRPGASLRLL